MCVEIVILSGSANRPLATSIARQLGRSLLRRTVERFPDGELHVEIEEGIRNDDVYIVQPTSPPVDEHLLELLLLADAARRAGAGRITAVVPYFGYARQDRRARGREALSGRLVADLIGAAGITRLVTVDLHSPALEGCFAFPVENMTAVPLLSEALAAVTPRPEVVVAPDLGAVKLAEHYARRLRLPVAIVHRQRLSGAAVAVLGIVGEVANREVLIVDDMITTGGTIQGAIEALAAAGARTPMTIAATHLLLVGDAATRLQEGHVRYLAGSDSVPLAVDSALPMVRVSLCTLLASTIGHLHHGRPIHEIGSHA
jgi:ribose-phosphate pyrophosphokinase